MGDLNTIDHTSALKISADVRSGEALTLSAAQRLATRLLGKSVSLAKARGEGLIVNGRRIWLPTLKVGRVWYTNRACVDRLVASVNAAEGGAS